MQDYPRKMVCLVEDNSDDGSYEFMEGLFTDRHTENVPDHLVAGTIGDLPAVLMKNEGELHGPSAARNVGIQLLMNSCHFIGVLDADDQYLQGKISRSVAALMKNPETIGLVYSDVLLYNEANDTYQHEFRQSYSREALMRENIVSNAPIMTRIALQETGQYDESLRTCEDWDMWLRITANYAAIHIPEPLQIYRIQDTGAASVSEEKWAEDRMTVLRKAHGQQSTT
jgi:glycosyltransferase involved in cell wall biosynthesis